MERCLIGAPKEGSSTVSDTTAEEGSIDAVAASLLEEPPKDDDVTDEVEASDDTNDEPEAEEAQADDAEEADEAATEDDGTDEDTDVADDNPAERLHTVRVNGRDLQVPYSELLRGYSGQAYVQEGMRQVAEQAKTLQREREQVAQILQAAQHGQLPLRPPEPPNEALKMQDPIGYLLALDDYSRAMQAHQQTLAQMGAVVQRQRQDEAQAHMARLTEEHRMLAQVIPDFATPEKAAKVVKDLIDVGQQAYGFTPEELRSVADHRQLRVLHDAFQYRQLMAKRSPAMKQADTQPRTPVMKPGPKVASKASGKVVTEKARAAMKRTGSVDDVARFLMS